MKQETKFEVVMHPRTIEHIIAGKQTSDGAVVKLARVLTQNMQQRLDPFLLFDNFRSDNPDDYIGGFPDHPHRDFETITYMIAGRGIIHSEMPGQENGVMEGFQLWLNLPARRKMIPAWYRDIPKAEIPEYVTKVGVTVRVIAGSSNGVAGAMIREDTEPLYLDIDMPAGSLFSTVLPAGYNAFVFVYRGELTIGGTQLGENRMAILANTPQADGVTLVASGTVRAILVAGKPLEEPIVQHGPFVMNTKEEIFQAIKDFNEGRLAEVR